MRLFDKSKLITVLYFAIFITCYVHNGSNAEATTWPISGTSFPKDINSDFGPRNYKDSPIHEGIDFNASAGAEVKSLTDGIVSLVQQINYGYGTNVRIESNGITYIYAHLYDVDHEETQYRPKVEKDDKVKKGDVIGYADNTGSSSGTHLHLTTCKIINGKVHKINPLGLDIFNYTAKPPNITKIDVKDAKGAVVSRLNIGNIYVDGKYELLKSIKGLKIEATVEDTEKDLNEVSYSATSTPAMNYSFIYPTSGFKAYTLKDSAMSKKGLPIKVKPGNVDKKDKSTDVFILDWPIAGLKKKDFDVNVKAKDIKKKSANKTVSFWWEPDAEVKDMEIKDSGDKTVEIHSKDQPVIEATLVPEESGGLFIPEHYSWSPRMMLYSNPQVIEPEITFSEDGSEAKISHQTSGLEDGPHTAVIEIVDESGNVTDSMQKIFYVDTKPPKLELVEPAGDEILRT